MFIPVLYFSIWKLSDDRQASDRSVFDLPQLDKVYQSMQRRVVWLGQNGALPQAEQLARKSTQLRPHRSLGFHNQACMLAIQGHSHAALECLRRAIATGNYSRQLMQADADLKSLRSDPRFRRMLEIWNETRPAVRTIWNRPAVSQLVTDRFADVTENNTQWNQSRHTLDVQFHFPQTVRTTSNRTTDDLLSRQIAKWHQAGTAAGNFGDLYDNRDALHSPLNLAEFPQLTSVVYGSVATAKSMHYGMQHALLFNAPTFGNSSTSVSGPYWRSNTRAMLCSANGPVELYRQYILNHMYVYPEHNDYDPAESVSEDDSTTDPTGGGSGDVFPANTPYVITSQGSSGSDQPFLKAILKTSAALRPQVKQLLVRSGTLMPTLQMLLRRSQTGINNDHDYLSGRAHPPVFSSKRLDVSRMVQMAQAIESDDLPPMIQMKVVREAPHRSGRDYFEESSNELLFTTPCAVARIHRSVHHDFRIVIDASNSIDLQGKPLTWHWQVLQGQSDRITIKPLNSQRSLVEISVGYHGRFPVANQSALETNRVDVGVFVHNGTHYSAPGFLSIFSLASEKRTYDDHQRVVEVDYTAPAARKNYVDPLLASRKDWRDVYSYDRDGRAMGWTRHRADQPAESFTRDGLLVTERDALGRATAAVDVHYVLHPQPGQPGLIKQVNGNRAFRYHYRDSDDNFGQLQQPDAAPNSTPQQ